MIKSLISGAGYDVHRIRRNQHADPFDEQQALLQGQVAPVIFDVGANVGNMVVRYKKMFPAATIHAFEPFAESFQKLQKNTDALEGVVLNSCGIADLSGKRQFHANRVASTNSLLPASPEGLATGGGERFKTQELVEVDLVTMDEYAQKHAISRIDLLKLDVQGAEPQVLAGASQLLASGCIDLIFTEIMVTHFYEGQQPLHKALEMYDRLGFKLYNFYDLSAFEGPLRQLDAIFVRK